LNINNTHTYTRKKHKEFCWDGIQLTNNSWRQKGVLCFRKREKGPYAGGLGVWIGRYRGW
jgi:hypothetical protein